MYNQNHPKCDSVGLQESCSLACPLPRVFDIKDLTLCLDFHEIGTKDVPFQCMLLHSIHVVNAVVEQFHSF